MYKCINGFTKAKMLEIIEARPLEERAFNNCYGVCAYLAPDGNKCAVGLFIPDGHPAQNSTDSVRGLLTDYPELVDKMPLSRGLMSHFQCIHDGCRTGNAKAAMLQWVMKNVED